MKAQKKADTKVKILISLQDPFGNKSTLRVTSDDFGALSFRLYGSWTPSGTPHALSNLQARGACPSSTNGYEHLEDLVSDIESWVSTGVKRPVETRLAVAISNN